MATRMDKQADSDDARTAATVAPTTHTPGPWRAAFGDDAGPRPGEFELACLEHHIFGTNIYAPGEYYSESLPEHEANARLIAAAPDLLAALKGLHDDIAEYAHINRLGGFDNHWMKAARAAIDKADGR